MISFYSLISPNTQIRALWAKLEDQLWLETREARRDQQDVADSAQLIDTVANSWRGKRLHVGTKAFR